MSRAVAATIAIALVAAGAVPAADDGARASVPCDNFARVDDTLYRGAEPDDACLDYLARIGVRTVLNLRDEADASRREREAAEALGLRYLNLPLSGISRPTEAALRDILDHIDAQGAQPVFVHCRRGRDRTGVVIAARRVLGDGWTADEAMREAKEFGLAWWQFPMKRLIRSGFAAAAPSDPAPPAPPAAPR